MIRWGLLLSLVGTEVFLISGRDKNEDCIGRKVPGHCPRTTRQAKVSAFHTAPSFA